MARPRKYAYPRVGLYIRQDTRARFNAIQRRYRVRRGKGISQDETLRRLIALEERINGPLPEISEAPA